MPSKYIVLKQNQYTLIPFFFSFYNWPPFLMATSALQLNDRFYMRASLDISGLKYQKLENMNKK